LLGLLLMMLRSGPTVTEAEVLVEVCAEDNTDSGDDGGLEVCLHFALLFTISTFFQH
jgi:hypothetical protein